MKEEWRRRLFQQLPKVDEFLDRESVASTLRDHARWLVLDVVRATLDEKRSLLAALESPPPDSDALLNDLESRFLLRLAVTARPRLRSLVNATGIIVHTNLGRANLPREALDHALAVGAGYSNLEYDLDAGRRGSRQDVVSELLCRLTGAEAAIAVNNNAAAVLLALGSLAFGKEVVVSRGELVEIGGSFRIPDVMARSGAVLREVGTTNKTHLADYSKALGADTGLLLKVHTSNFQVVGFSSAVSTGELAQLANSRSVPFMEDLGSGSLVDLSPFGLPGEPTVQEVVAAGAHVVSFSGDKLLGGPQAGLIVGRRDLIDRLRTDPFHRSVRLDKFTLAALEATLKIYLEGERAFEKIPVLRMISEPLDAVRRRAAGLRRRLSPECRSALDVAVVASSSQVGGGSLPTSEIPSAALALNPGSISCRRLEEILRAGAPPVIGRIHEDRLLLDMRTVSRGEIPAVAAALESSLRS